MKKIILIFVALSVSFMLYAADPLSDAYEARQAAIDAGAELYFPGELEYLDSFFDDLKIWMGNDSGTESAINGGAELLILSYQDLKNSANEAAQAERTAAFQSNIRTDGNVGSYTNNEYQKLAFEYTDRAQAAFDDGEYDLSIEYSSLAAENAELSQAYIKMMILKQNTDRKLRQAYRRLVWAQNVNAPQTFPLAFSAAEQYYETAISVYGEEDYESSFNYAQLSLDALAEVTEVVPLPQYYVVLPWAQARDCFWNIAGRSYVYNDPYLWENLYQANKNNIPQPNNPNLIHPGMKMLIPSISGELRSGIYDPKVKYNKFEK